MKVKGLKIKNIGKFTDFEIEFNGSITRLVGVNGSGKSSMLTAIWAGLKGIAEKNSTGQLIGERFRFIGQGGATGEITVKLIDEAKGAEILVKNKISKSGNNISFEAPDGYAISHEWLNNLLSVAFLSAKNFTQLSGREQASLLGIDTSEFDAKQKELKTEFTGINARLKQYQNLAVVEEVNPVDIAELTAKKDTVRAALNQKYQDNKAHNEKLRKGWEGEKAKIDKEVSEFNKANAEAKIIYNECLSAEEILNRHGFKSDQLTEFIDNLHKSVKDDKSASELYPAEPTYITELPDDSELQAIDAEILAATETNHKANLYQQYLDKLKEKEVVEAELQKNKDDQAANEAKRLEYIKSFDFGFKGLEVDEDGGLTLNGRPIKDPYFSKGELEVIVAKLYASQNPDLKLRFIDDFDLVDPDNQAKIIDGLLAEGFQIITAEVGNQSGENTIMLRECKIVESYEDKEKNDLI